MRRLLDHGAEGGQFPDQVGADVAGRGVVVRLAEAPLNRAVAADPRVEQVIVPLRDGLTLTPPGLRRSMRIRHLDPMGVEVSELRLADVDAAVAARLRGLLADRGVLVLPGQDADDAAFLAFLRAFGALTFTVGETPVPGFADLNVVSNVGRATPPRSQFHVDTSYVRRPPAYTALRAVRLPERGGATVFSDQYRAYDTLPADVRERLRGRTIRHVATGVRLGEDDEASAEHPVFRPHPLSGRTALYISTPEALRRDQRAGPARGAGDDRLPDRALHARGQPLPAPLVAGRRRHVGQRLRPAQRRPRRRRRRPRHAPRHGRRVRGVIGHRDVWRRTLGRCLLTCAAAVHPRGDGGWPCCAAWWSASG